MMNNILVGKYMIGGARSSQGPAKDNHFRQEEEDWHQPSTVEVAKLTGGPRRRLEYGIKRFYGKCRTSVPYVDSREG